MNCPVCSAPNVDGAAFCDNCGAKLGAAPAPVAVPLQPPAAVGSSAVCPSCQSPVIPGTAFCDICGAAIPAVAPTSVAPAAVPQAPAAQAGGQVRCSNCGAQNGADQAFCDNCGQRLGGAAPAGGPPQQTPSVAAGPRTTLTLAASGVTFDLAGKTRVLIGRADPVSGVNPDVDLTPHGGDEGGVSRRHAELAFDGHQWQIKDLDSTNGSAVNNQRLSPNASQALKSGDQIRVGKVVLVFQAA